MGNSSKKHSFLLRLSLTLVVVSLMGLALSGSNHDKKSGKLVAIAETTTTVLPTTTIPAPPPTTIARVIPRRASRGALIPRYAGPIDDDVFIRLSWCEAGGRANAVSRNGKYFGAWQFTLSTWHSLGYAGNPIDYSYDEQLQAAKKLQQRSGFRSQWPVCSRKLGLA